MYPGFQFCRQEICPGDSVSWWSNNEKHASEKLFKFLVWLLLRKQLAKEFFLRFLLLKRLKM